LKIPIRNIALFAHVDAGKTSLSEQFLFHSGKIRKLGSVDKGNTQTDSLQVEKERGITVDATILSFKWKDTQINLIDTPGHIDFSSETEMAIQVIDSAVVIISAYEGVQAQTENLVALLQKYQKPFVIFVNKLDRSGVDLEEVIQEIEKELFLRTFVLQKVQNEGTENVTIQTIWNQENYQIQTELIEIIIEDNTQLFEQYLEDLPLAFDVLNQEFIKNIHNQKLVPVLFGSAKLDLGITELLDGVISILPNPPKLNAELQGIVFKTKHVKGEGKWAGVRLFSGEIFARTEVLNATNKRNEKVGLLKNIDLQNQKIIPSFKAGEIAWIQGLQEAKPGDYLGSIPKNSINNIETTSFLSVQLTPEKELELNNLVTALQILNNENPDLNFSFLKEERELHINIRGEIQKEIIQSILQTRFGINVNFSQPTVIYKETPTVEAEGYVRNWMPKPCWAIMTFKIEPAERGSGVQYSSIVGVNDIKKQYQKDVEKSIPKSLQQGILGWEVDDVKITLISGEDHEVHTKSNDFFIVTSMGIMEGLKEAKMTLLEPFLHFKIIAPEAFLGKITSLLIKCRAELNSPIINDNKMQITGKFPVATTLDLPIKLSAITSGKAKIRTWFAEYKICPVHLGKTRNYKGISPLDRAKYILKARKALG